MSRRHLELSVNEDGEVCVASLGREPVLVNKEQVLSPRVLQTGDKIEVLLEGRTREFFFKANVAKKEAAKEKRREKSVGSPPLVASSVANRRSGGQAAEAAVAEEAVEAAEAPEEAQMEEPEEKNEPVDAVAMEADDVVPAPRAEPAPQDAISLAVSQLVQDILDRVVQSVDAAAAILTPVPSSAKRKSVRFVANKTPEGDACDATMTIRCVPRDDGQPAVLVEDNTMAISEWGFKTMQTNEIETGQEGEEGAMVDGVPNEAEKDLDNMEEDARDDGDKSNQLTPASIGERVPLHGSHSMLASPHRSSKLNFEAVSTGAVSQGTPGMARAPATTPVTAAKPFIVGQKKDEEVDFAALAQKLEEIAEEHDVKFELPKDFMRFTPVPSVSKSKRKSIGEVMSSRSVGGTAGTCKRLSICSSKEGSIEYELPKDFMRFTPMVKSALKNVEQTMTAVGGIHESPEDGGEEIATLRSVGHAVHDLADALEEVKSVKRSVGKSVRSKTPGAGVRITIVEKGSTFKTANPEVKILFNMPGDARGETENPAGEANGIGGDVDVDAAQDGQGQSPMEVEVEDDTVGAATVDTKDDATTPKAAKTAKASTPAADLVGRFKTALAQARAYKTQALVLGKHLKKSSAKLAKANATSKVLSIRYRAEKAKRIELQNTIKRLVEAREAQEMDAEVEVDMDMDTETKDAQEDSQCRVVVLGHTESPANTRIEMAGTVAVVRPGSARLAATTPATAKRKRPSGVATTKSAFKSAAKSAVKSVRRVSLGGDKVRVLVDDIELPQWMFDKDQDEDREIADQVGGMDDGAADVDDDEAEEAALKSLEAALESPLPDGPSKQEVADADAEASPEACFVCGVGDDGDVLLLCDSCDNACHLACCKPARKTVPKGDWFCAECKAASKKRKAPAAKPAAAAKAKSVRASKENVMVADKAAAKTATSVATMTATRATRRSARN